MGLDEASHGLSECRIQLKRSAEVSVDESVHNYIKLSVIAILMEAHNVILA